MHHSVDPSPTKIFAVPLFLRGSAPSPAHIWRSKRSSEYAKKLRTSTPLAHMDSLTSASSSSSPPHTPLLLGMCHQG